MGLLFWKVDHGDHFYKNIEHIRRTDRSKIRSAWSQTLRTPLVFGHVCYCCRVVHDIFRGRLRSRFHRERSDSLFCATAGSFALGGRHRHRRRSDHTRFLAIITTMAAMGEAPGVSFGGGLFDRVGRLFRVCVFLVVVMVGDFQRPRINYRRAAMVWRRCRIPLVCVLPVDQEANHMTPRPNESPHLNRRRCPNLSFGERTRPR